MPCLIIWCWTIHVRNRCFITKSKKLVFITGKYYWRLAQCKDMCCVMFDLATEQSRLNKLPLWWRHNDHDSVSNHQPHECLLNRLIRRRSKKTSKLRVTGLCVGNSPGPVNSPHKGPVTRKMFPFDNVIMQGDQVQSCLHPCTPKANRMKQLNRWQICEILSF